MSQQIIPDQIPETLKNFDKLPDEAQVRLPVVMVLYGCSAATVWRSVKNGHIPKPEKLTPGIASWNVGTLRRSKEAKREV